MDVEEKSTPHKVTSIEVKPPQDLKYFLDTKTTDLTLALQDGLHIAIKCWGDEHADVKILAVHGWLDNASSWDRLAPLLVSSHRVSVRLVAMDFSGHGRSGHRTASSTYLLPEHCLEIQGVADCLGWDKFFLMAHSMGASIATLFASALGNRVQGLILMDGIGPFAMPGQHNPATILRECLKERPKILHRQRRVYSNIEQAIQRYRQRVNISDESARLLVQRGTEEVEVFGLGGKGSEKGICFRHDPRLRGNALMRYSQNDAVAICRNLTCPTLLILADNEMRRRFPKELVAMLWEKVNAIPTKALDLFVINANHHFHMDYPQAIYGHILDLLVRCVKPSKL